MTDYGAWARGGLVLPGREDWCGPFRLDRIYQGDAKRLARYIPDESVDLIFTDPVYQNIDDYRWLAETAARVLKPNRACLVYAPIGDLPRVHAAMNQHLQYRWRFVIRPLFGHGTGQWVGKLRISTKEILWYEKGKSRLKESIFDLQMISTFGYADFKVNGRVWEKHPNEILRVFSALSEPDALVLDPFAGGGTVPAVCKQLGRRYLAFEIDHATAVMARERVAQTQPPLFVLEPEQLALPEAVA